MMENVHHQIHTAWIPVTHAKKFKWISIDDMPGTWLILEVYEKQKVYYAGKLWDPQAYQDYMGATVQMG
jgi:hypothetical protein